VNVEAAPVRKRVLIFTISLGGGGAEAQALRVANNLDRSRFDVEVAVLRGGGSYEPMLASDVAFHVLGGGNLLSKAGSLRRLVRRLRPDVLCSFLEIPNLMAAWAARGLKPRPHLVACVQAPPSITWKGGGWRPALRALVSRYYSRAEQIVAISHGVASDIATMAPGAEAHMTTIHNAGVDERVESGAAMPLEPDDVLPGGPLLVACGRLAEQKGYPYLIDAFALVHEEVPDASLWILGQGPDRPAVERQIADLSLGDSVRLLGFRDNPFRYMAAADLFVLSSIFEGFGNVVAEAMACGTAVVSTDCPYGPSEIITDGVNGLLVPTRDPQALAAAILRVLRDPALKARLAEEGRRRSKDFDAATITARYAQVFETVCAGRTALGG
jgi:glycosyltransferase involved in cell wall biosynthesis